ncbi:Hsp20/alpha crystallin family protein [Bradyrhizobium sp. INPA01-394B]|uniref:Hsp20/alpha crystallin family protein n=1 Tax=Bradyrhizobium campsiandrae TaxID=1729892 RepID=A0ABR7U453_9BRAD|nr:Hsp20/alpha crystallin family protein [Bradyrhizobium campsiandrae]MBC9978197.1 Hsp20/alpha crystallin family protein [Bradyrhizobium campsiandrae]
MLAYPGNAGRTFDPFRQMRLMQQDVKRVMNNLRAPTTSEFPPINIWTGPDGAVITAEIPGVAADDLDIAVHQNTVTLRGKRDIDPVAEGAVVHRQERVAGSFARSLVLPFRVDGEKAAAAFRNGLLRLELPRPDADRPRKIAISRT